MENLLFKLNEVNPRCVYKDNEGVLNIKNNKSNLSKTEKFKKKYNRFIFDKEQNVLISRLRSIFSKFYGSSYTINPPFTVTFFKLLFMPAPKIINLGKILDIGCSTGEFLISLPGGWEKSGIEINAKAAILALKKGLNVQNVSLEKYKTSKKFDLVRACHVIEHFDNYGIFFQKVANLLKKGGLLVIYTPNSESFSYLLTKNNWSGFYDTTHFQIFNLENLSKIAGKYNLKLISKSSYYMGYLTDSLIRMLKISNPKIVFLFYYVFSIAFYPFSIIDKILTRGDSLMAVLKKD